MILMMIIVVIAAVIVDVDALYVDGIVRVVHAPREGRDTRERHRGGEEHRTGETVEHAGLGAIAGPLRGTPP
jgi:hypothetical protein